jgi:Leucine-rich repeat (LRR) protein
MKVHNLRALGAAVLLVFLSATTVTVPIAAHARLAPAAFDCSTATGIPSSECQALVALYNSTSGAGWTNQSGWLITNTPCGWYGMTCSTGHVTELHLDSNQLSGSIPPELGNLANLQNLSLNSNQLSGYVPYVLGNLSNLQYLDLNSNQLSGSIPFELGNLTNLQRLALGGNQLSGNITYELGNLTNLQDLDLGSNQLSGNIPYELGNLVNLQYLRLHDNQLSGSIPPQLGNLANLQGLWLHVNQLRGPLPQSLTSLHALETFYYDTALLCAPDNTAFQAWLAGIHDRSTGGTTCKTCYLPVVIR